MAIKEIVKSARISVRSRLLSALNNNKLINFAVRARWPTRGVIQRYNMQTTRPVILRTMMIVARVAQKRISRAARDKHLVSEKSESDDNKHGTHNPYGGHT